MFIRMIMCRWMKCSLYTHHSQWHKNTHSSAVAGLESRSGISVAWWRKHFDLPDNTWHKISMKIFESTEKVWHSTIRTFVTHLWNFTSPYFYLVEFKLMLYIRTTPINISRRIRIRIHFSVYKSVMRVNAAVDANYQRAQWDLATDYEFFDHRNIKMVRIIQQTTETKWLNGSKGENRWITISSDVERWNNKSSITNESTTTTSEKLCIQL